MSHLHHLLPVQTRIRLLISWLAVLAFQLGADRWLADPVAPLMAVICFVLLFLTIFYAAFGVVHEADHLSRLLGEPYGTLILTLSVVTIEVVLIAAVMLGPGEAPTIGRDSIFAVMMIIMNLVMGLCLLLGGLRFGEQAYNLQGTLAYLSMILLLTVAALVLPNLVSSGNGSFLPLQAWIMALMTGLLYTAFLLMQMRGYRRFFVQPQPDSMNLRATLPQPARQAVPADKTSLLVRSLLLVLLMLPIILLAQHLAVLIDLGIAITGAPVAVGGVLIAIIVFTPESITAIKAALNNEMQRVANLCLGAFVSTVGLTVPAVLVIGQLSGKLVVLGLSPVDTLLMGLTLGLTSLSFLAGRTSSMQGLMHLMLFGIYGLLLFLP